MTEQLKPLPCPFCGSAAHFFKIADLDEKNFGGEGICCGSCPITTDLMFSLMEDCKPKLAEAWNRRAQPAQAVPVAVVKYQVGGLAVHIVGDVREGDELFKAPQQAEAVPQLTRDFPAVQQSRAVVEQQAERYRELMGDDVKNALKQPQAVPIGSVTHDLKLLPEYFAEVQAGTKTFELRKDDRGFRVGDSLRLHEWSEAAGYTGREALRRVLGILRGPIYGLKEGFTILSMAPQQVEVVPPPNCRQRLAREGKLHPRSSCAVCGPLSPKWQKCNLALALEGDKK